MTVLATMRSFISTTWSLAGRTVRKFGRDNGLFLASGLAFNLLLYAIPLGLIMISLLGYTVLESEQAMEEVQAVIRQFLPQSEQTFAEHVTAIAADRGLLGVAGFVSFVVFSTMVFASIRHVLNVVFRAGPGRSFLRGTLHDLLMMVFCTALLAVTVGVASAFTLFDYLGDLAPWTTPLMSRALRLARGVTGFLLGGGLIFGLYRFSPARSLSVRALIVGAAVTVALFEFARQAFTWYVRFAEAAVTLYGVLGAFVFLFFWLYYASAIFVLGAEAAWTFEHRETGQRPHAT